MQGEDDEGRADGVGERVEGVGGAARNEDLVQLVHGAGGGDDEPGGEGRVAAQARPEDGGHAAEGHGVHGLVPREVHQPLDDAGLVEYEQLREERGESEEAGGPDPAGRRERDRHG